MERESVSGQVMILFLPLRHICALLASELNYKRFFYVWYRVAVINRE